MIQFKHSTVSGNVPNLVPGQIGVNEADEYLWIRANGKKVAIDLNQLQNYAAPITNGQDGAPLIKTATGSQWMPSLAPSSLVDGAITVDQAQPTNIYGIPGVMISGTGSSVDIPDGMAVAEHFYVASDWIQIDQIVFNILSQTQSLMRFAIVDDDGNNLATGQVTSPIVGVNRASIGVALPNGHYRLIMWSSKAKEFLEITGYSIDQGWTLSGTQAMQFLDRQLSAQDFSVAINVVGITWTDSTQPTPGIRRLFGYHWSIPVF